MAGINIVTDAGNGKVVSDDSKNAFSGMGTPNGLKVPVTLDFGKARESSTGKVLTMYVSFTLPSGRRVWGNLNIGK